MKKLVCLLFIALGITCSRDLRAQAPSTQASNAQVTYKTSAGATVTWTRGNGSACLVVIRKASSAHAYPANGPTNYASSGIYGNGTSLGSGDNFVVYKGTGTGVFISGLTQNTLYDVYVYEYNTVLIFGTTYYYYNTSTSGATGFSTLATPPSACGSIVSATSITNSSATINFTAGNGNGRFVTMVQNGYSANTPTNGYYYSPSSAYGSGALLGSAYAVYNNSGTSVNVTNLAGATTYRVYDYEYNNGSYPTYSTYNYNTKSYLSCGYYTFSTTNIPPTISSVPSQTVCENTSLVVGYLNGLSDGSTNENQNLTITATTNNTTLLPTINVSYSNPNAYGYLFMYPAAGQYGTATVTVTVNDGWSVNNITTVTFTVTVLPFPGAAGAIAGSSPICAGLGTQTYSIAPVSNATGYTWTVPSGFTVTAGSGTNVITVTTNTATGSGTIAVYGTNANGCGNGTISSKNIQVDKQPADPYAGADQPMICGSNASLGATPVTSPDAGTWSWLSGTPVPSIGSTTVASTSLSGLGGPNTVYKYTWTVARAGSVCPSKTDTVVLTTDWNNINCQPAADFAYSPSSDVASNKVCVNTPINFTDLSISANTWSWDFNYQGGAPNFTSTQQNPSYTYTTVGTYSVYLRIYSNATSQNYNTVKTITVIGAPATPGTIFGTTSGICEGDPNQIVYSTSPVTDATGYSWSVPPGAHIDAYPSSTSIATSYPNGSSSGLVGVSASNSCGTSGTSTLAIIVSPLPNSAGNTISGPAAVCQGQNNASYSISGYANASSYTWTDLNGTQTTGTSTFTMNIGQNDVSGTIYVWGNNACGSGDTVSFAVTVNPLPGNATNITGPTSINLCPSSGNILFVADSIGNATSYNWYFPTGFTVTGGNGMDSMTVSIDNTVQGGNQQISVVGNNACGIGGSANLGVFVNAPVAPQICMVTVDSLSTHNIIYWDKTNITGADSFRIYREDQTNVYTYIGSLQYNALSEYHDYGADPNVTTKRYKISSVDSCGNESALSNYHNTVYIIDNHNGQFSWPTLYTIENGPNPVTNYALMRDDYNTGTYNQVAITAGTQQVITDPNYSTYMSTANWYVETVWGISCTSTGRQIDQAQGTIVKSKSNIANNRTTAVKNTTAGGTSVVIYPNPTSGKISIVLPSDQKEALVKITSLIGEEMYSGAANPANGTHTVDMSAFPAGVYLVQVTGADLSVTKRVVKN